MSFVKKAILEVGIFSAAVNLLLLVSPIYLLQIYDRVLPAQSLSTLIYLSIICAAAFLTLCALEIVRSYYANRIASQIDVSLGGKAFLATITGSRAAMGDIQPLRDLSTIRAFLSSKAIFFLFDLPFAPFFLLLMYFIHPALFLLTLIGVVVLVLVALANERATMKSEATAGEASSETMMLAQTFARMQETVRALGMTSSVAGVWGRRFADQVTAHRKVADTNAFFSGISRMLRTGLQTAMLGLGAYLVLQGQMTAGMIFASSLIAGRALQPMDQIIGGWRQIGEARKAWRRLGALREMKLEHERETIRLPNVKGSLIVENLVYQLPDGDASSPLIKRLNFQIQAGESVAIVGPSRAGKSTLARLIVGALKPNAGLVRLDGADIRTWDPDMLGSHIGYLPQEVDLLPGTVAQNISRFAEQPADDDIVGAAQRAQAHELILRMKKGYLTEIGASGVRLSGGERQRVGLARAFYGGPRLLVLDEPNASLDAEGEMALELAIKEAKANGVTILLITHKPSIAAKCDRVLVLRDGQIDLFGPAADVLQRLAGTPVVPQRPTPAAPVAESAATATFQTVARVKAN
ncbi:type I secretion system permease/ATPase [Tianweitania sp. Rool2]|uniref:Type I secretion system permease/ATPase n=1 Tax=Oryzicola mucosus TaxID=2767425 RepID=A0A8J6PSF1_9HYPH|nr:type I secretion system permease/ATPase [Oryzicola mucosus]MBD0413131.1 type I secretion system permease/ATPase [Oryzicola mucosus]